MTTKLRYAITILALLFSLPGFNQSLIGKKEMHDSTCLQIGSEMLDEFGNSLYAAAEKGQLTLYRDSLLKQSYAKEEVFSLFVGYLSMQLINPANPDDPYDLIDTLVPYTTPATQWKNIRKGEDFLFVTISNSQHFYLPQKHFTSPSGLLKNHLICLDLIGNHNTSGHDFPGLLRKRTDSIQVLMYRLFIERAAIFYMGPDTNSEALPSYAYYESVPCMRRENIQSINPLNPEDPYDLIDTVVTTLPSMQDLDHLIFANTCIPGDVRSPVQLTAVFFTCSSSQIIRHVQNWPGGKTNAITIPRWPTGWLMWEDAQKHFPEEDLRILHYLNAWNLLH